MNESDISFMKSNKLLEYDKIEIFDGGEGVDIDRYAPCKELVEHSYFKVVMVSRVLKTKGFHEFVQAAKFSKDAGLDIQYFLAGGIDEIHPDRISRQEIEQAQKMNISTTWDISKTFLNSLKMLIVLYFLLITMKE